MNIQLKICGLKYEDNISQVAALQPDYIGFIFYKKSARYVGDDFPTETLKNIPSGIKKVGVFVNAPLEEIMNNVIEYNLDFVQLHGNEVPEYCNTISQVTNVIKSFGIDKQFDFSACDAYKNYCSCFLFDTATSNYGGSGKIFNRELLNQYKSDKPFFLSGGVGLEEIESIQNSPHEMMIGIDVNSKFESKPGFKNIDKLQSLINILKTNDSDSTISG